MWWQYTIVALVVAISIAIVTRAFLRMVRAKGCAAGCSSAGKLDNSFADRHGREHQTVPLNISDPRTESPKC